MSRNVSVTFKDGTKTIYRDVPDDITPEQIQARAEEENNAGVIEIDGGAQLPEEADIPVPATAPTTAPAPLQRSHQCSSR